MLDELKKISLPSHVMELYHENLKAIGTIDAKDLVDTTGYPAVTFARADLYDLILSKIHPSKIHMKKKIMSILQNDEGVMIRCSDNTQYHGDIFIGADGAYSGVRQSLYKQLDDHGLFPAEDREQMQMAYICMVGTTGPLDPVNYPSLKNDSCHFATVLGGK
ncbi:hypothetical protein BGZ82_006222 [Podila clonocystis]|nr:hypothetical protein BGZ82_006222 [Podila clonocystis]